MDWGMQLFISEEVVWTHTPKGSDALRLGSKGRYGLCVGGR